jgi:hypothetical protein
MVNLLGEIVIMITRNGASAQATGCYQLSVISFQLTPRNRQAEKLRTDDRENRLSVLVSPRRGGRMGEAAENFEIFGFLLELYAAHPVGHIVPRKFKAILAGVPGFTERFLVELAAVLLIGCEVFRWENDVLAGEAVAKCVEGYAALAFGTGGAGGMGGVLAVDFGAINGCRSIHKKNLGQFSRGIRGS